MIGHDFGFLGLFPTEWLHAPFWTNYRRVKRPASGDEELLSVYREYGVVRKSDRDDNHNKASEDRSLYQAVKPGDLVINKMKAWQGSVAISSLGGIVSPAYFVFEPDNLVCDKYMHYLMRCSAFVAAFRAASKGIRPGQWDLDPDVLRTLPISAPSIKNQERIAKFLDAETAEIDAFITDQEELIALLAERRAATIGRIVSKGLDPTSEMRESGVRWLGDVPVHWQAGNIRRFAIMKTGHTPSRSNEEYWLDCTIPWFTLADVWQLRQGQTYLGKTSAEISLLGLQNSAAELLPAGTVVLSRTASVGFSGIMPQPMATSQDYWNWICKPSLLPKYLWYQFLAMRPFLGSLVHGSTHKTIYQADAASLGIAAPPIGEQELILGYLDRETAELDAAIADAREAIALSRERRAALISAAVTGKIDVRGAV